LDSMATRTTKSRVTFKAPFTLTGIDGEQPAGSYDVETDEEAIEGNDHTVYRRVATIFYLTGGGVTRSCRVNPEDLAAALARDVNAAPSGSH
jgi:hypothetical protein